MTNLDYFKNLRNSILEIIIAIKKTGRKNLARCVKENWRKSALEYSKELNSYKPHRNIEDTMLIAFEKEFKRLGFSSNLKYEIINFIKERRVVQTAPHLCITEIPRMLFINWLGSLGVSDKDFYIVLEYSGIPFSNYQYPGRINKANGSINLFPAVKQDAMVYRSLIEQKLIDNSKNFGSIKKSDKKSEKSDEIQKFFPQKFFPNASVGDSYTKYALLSCVNIEKKILNKKNLIFLDFNEIITQYLLQVLRDPKHVLYKLFFDKSSRDEFIKAFHDEAIFFSPIQNGKYEKMQKIIFHKNILRGKNKEISLEDNKSIIFELENNRLCPGLIIGFFALSFINHFKCFGSFKQVEYLSIYKEKLEKLKFLKSLDFSMVPTANLTTGSFPENPNLYQMDVLMGEHFPPHKNELYGNKLFGEFLIPIKKNLLN